MMEDFKIKDVKYLSRFLGLELGEEFKVRPWNYDIYKFEEDGLYSKGLLDGSWTLSTDYLFILAFTEDIVKLPKYNKELKS